MLFSTTIFEDQQRCYIAYIPGTSLEPAGASRYGCCISIVPGLLNEMAVSVVYTSQVASGVLSSLVHVDPGFLGTCGGSASRYAS
jgi:hypothetical protein